MCIRRKREGNSFMFGWNYPRNPLLILVFCFIGISIRFCLINSIRIIIAKKPKHFFSFSDGFNQVVINLLLTLFSIVFFVIYAIYKLNIVS